MDYPFDSEFILRNKRSLKKEFENHPGLIKKNIALLSGTTIGEIKSILEIFLLQNGIQPVFYIGDYNKYYEDIVFDDGTLGDFHPDVIYIHAGLKCISGFPDLGASPDACRVAEDSIFASYKTVWKAAEKYSCPVIQDNIEYPAVRVMGNFEGVHPSGKIRIINRLNERFAQYAYESKGLYINDVCYLSSRFGIDNFADPTYYNAYKYSVSPDYVPFLCYSVSNIIKSLFGKNKKALISDLDNTLWNGVIGDDGIEGIKIGKEMPEGIAFSDMQQYLKDLSKIGVILGICSKNEEEVAKSGFSHPSSVLSVDDFVSFKANWHPKADNLTQTAEDMNLGIDSFVFTDDNPAEREIIRAMEKGVAVPELSAPEYFARTISDAGYFEVTSLSEDDKHRIDMYKQNNLRSQVAATVTDYGEYLKSLEMKGYIEPFTTGAVERITQLANKTNQFNLTTRRYTIEEMTDVIFSPSYITLYGRLEDKFGDNGIVTEIIAKKNDDTLDIVLWLMSCRVFKRELEYAMFDSLVEKALSSGIKKITGHYYKSEKNVIVKDFYRSLGFVSVEESDTDWEYEIPQDYKCKNNSIEVVK